MRDLNISFGERSPAKKQSDDGASAERRSVVPTSAQEEVQVAPTRARAQVPVQVAPKKAVPWSMTRATTPLVLPVGKQQRQSFQITQGAEGVRDAGGLPGAGGWAAQGQPQVPWTGAADFAGGQQGAQGAGQLAGAYPGDAAGERVTPAPPVVVTRTEPMIAPTVVTAVVPAVDHVLTTPVVEVLGVTGAVGDAADGAVAAGAGVGVGAAPLAQPIQTPPVADESGDGEVAVGGSTDTAGTVGDEVVAAAGVGAAVGADAAVVAAVVADAAVGDERPPDIADGFAVEGTPATPTAAATPTTGDDALPATASLPDSPPDATAALASPDETPAAASAPGVDEAPAALRGADGTPSSIADKIPLVVTDTDKTPTAAAAAASAAGSGDLPIDPIAVVDVDEMLAAVVASLDEAPGDTTVDVDAMFAALVADLEKAPERAGTDPMAAAAAAPAPPAAAPAPTSTPAPAPATSAPAPAPAAKPASAPASAPVPAPASASAPAPDAPAPAPAPKPARKPAKPRSRRQPWADPDETSDLFVAGAYEMPATTADDSNFPRGPKTVPSPPVRPQKRARFDKTHAKDASAAADKRRGTHSKRERKTGTLQYVFVALRDVAIVLALFCILLQFFSPTVVREHSMEDTLVEKDILFVANKAYWFGAPGYGDVVLFHTTLTTESGAEKTLVKRLIGLPGDRISINGGIVFRNGEPLDEPYLKEGITIGAMSEVEVPEGSYFVMGDNRAVSRDSRDSSVGFVKESQLRGKIVLRIFPLDRFRTF